MLRDAVLKKRAEKFRLLYQAARQAGKDAKTALLSATTDAARAFPLPKISTKRKE